MVGVAMTITVIALLAVLYIVGSVIGLVVDGISGRMSKPLAFGGVGLITLVMVLGCCGVLK